MSGRGLCNILNSRRVVCVRACVCVPFQIPFYRIRRPSPLNTHFCDTPRLIVTAKKGLAVDAQNTGAGGTLMFVAGPNLTTYVHEQQQQQLQLQ